MLELYLCKLHIEIGSDGKVFKILNHMPLRQNISRTVKTVRIFLFTLSFMNYNISFQETFDWATMSSFTAIKSEYAIGHQSQHDPDVKESGVHSEQWESYDGMDERGFETTSYGGHGNESKNCSRAFQMSNSDKKPDMSDLSDESSVFLSDLASPEKKVRTIAIFYFLLIF